MSDTLLAVALCKKVHCPSSTRAHPVFRVHAAVSHPKLFSALILLDPVIVLPLIGEGMAWADYWGALDPLTALLDGAVARRNGWGSKYVFCRLLR